MINKENYSIYIIDYLDGKLHEKEVSALFSFLEKHEDLKAEFDGLSNYTLSPLSEIIYAEKNLLKKDIIHYKEINVSNYEAFFLDFHENNLTEETRTDVLNFVQQNPILKKEFEMFMEVKLEPKEQSLLLEKEKLEKDELKANPILESMIALLEGDLDLKSSEKLKHEIDQDAAISKEYHLLKKTFLKADLSTSYQGKSSLKHYSLTHAESKGERYYWAVAASVALLLGISAYFYLMTSPQMGGEVANNLIKDSIYDKAISNKNQNDSTTLNEQTIAKVKNLNRKVIYQKSIQEAEKEFEKNEEITTNSLLTVYADSIKQTEYKIEALPLASTDEKKQDSKQEIIANSSNSVEQSNPYNPSLSGNKNEEYLSLGSLAERMLDKKIKDQDIKDEIERLPKSRNKFNQIASLAFKAISRVSGGKLKYENCYDSNGDMVAYNVSLGSFQLSKNSCR